jgi:hypothetical protein
MNPAMTPAQVTPQATAKPLNCDEILRVAREDAERVYKDLASYKISLILQTDGWHVEYNLTKPFMAGGGPYYVIDPMTGAILSKKYYQ